MHLPRRCGERWKDAVTHIICTCLPYLTKPIRFACPEIRSGPQIEERICLRESGYKIGDIYPSFFLFSFTLQSAHHINLTSKPRFLLLQSSSSINRTNHSTPLFQHSQTQNVSSSPHPRNSPPRDHLNDSRPRPSQLKASSRYHSSQSRYRDRCPRYLYAHFLRLGRNNLVYLDRLD